ncbi:hypothetical protein [Shewanella vesiculosa]
MMNNGSIDKIKDLTNE